MERSLKVLHDEAIRKVVAQEKPQHKAKKLRFSQQSKQFYGSSARKSSFQSDSSKASFSSCIEGRGRNFEGSSLPSQPQVGGVFGWHWRVWQSFSADEWTVALLRDGYRVPFHHLPPVSLNPRELQEEVSKMLLKGALETVDQPGPGFYSQLFLVEKVTGGWQPDIDLSALNGFVKLMKFQMETVISVLGSIR